MKKTVLAAGMAIWIIVAGLLIWFLVANLSGGSTGAFGIQFGSTTNTALLKDESASTEGIENLAVEVSHHTITFRTSDTDAFRVLQYGENNTPEDRLFRMSKDGDVLRITMNRGLNINIGVNMAREEIVVLVPRGWTGGVNASSSSGTVRLEEEFNWQDVSLNTSSGSIRLPGIRCGELNIGTSSGSVRCEGSIAAKGDIKIKTTSGSIRLAGETEGQNISLSSSSGTISLDGEINSKALAASAISGSIRFGSRMTADDLKLSTSSGSIRTNGIIASTYDVQSTSGSISTGSLSGGGRLKTSSGSITAELLTPVRDVTADSTSGTVRLTLPDNLSFTFDAKSNSGSIKTNFDTLYRDSRGKEATASVGGNPTSHIRVSTSSGSIHVNR